MKRTQRDLVLERLADGERDLLKIQRDLRAAWPHKLFGLSYIGQLARAYERLVARRQ